MYTSISKMFMEGSYLMNGFQSLIFWWLRKNNKIPQSSNGIETYCVKI